MPFEKKQTKTPKISKPKSPKPLEVPDAVLPTADLTPPEPMPFTEPVSTSSRVKLPEKTVTSTIAKTSTKASTSSSKVSEASQKISALEARLDTSEKLLSTLITVIHNDLQRGQLQGPEGLAAKLRKAGLLSS
jgi:hypothetical protein